MNSSNNSKSLLAIAGNSSIKNYLSYVDSHAQKYVSKENRQNSMVRTFQQHNNEYQMRQYGGHKDPDIQINSYAYSSADTKRLMIKLTLPRLRKMQALVRGFLVRRKVYPIKLQEYLIAKSVYELILCNAVSKQSSQIVLQNITFPKYQQDGTKQLYGYQATLQNQIFGVIYRRATQNYIKTIVQQSVTQKALYFSRPQITFGFNLRSAEGLFLYEVLIKQIRGQSQKIAEECIRQHADYWREIKFMQQIIQNNSMLDGLYEEIVAEAYKENMAAIMADLIIERCLKQASHAVSVSSFENQTLSKKKLSLLEMQQQVWNQIIQQGILQAILESEE